MKLWLVLEKDDHAEKHIVMAETAEEALVKAAALSYEFPPYAPDDFETHEISSVSSMPWWAEAHDEWKFNWVGDFSILPDR